MYDFGNANEAQRQAIATTEGPLLMIAGPGTGKTKTLVQRTIYLIEEKHVQPEQILIATFTEKAAKELLTRISGALTERGIAVNLNEMYIGTFHQICLRILKDHMEYTRLKKNFRVMEQFEQQYFLLENIRKFQTPAANHLIGQFLWKSAFKPRKQDADGNAVPKEWPFVKTMAGIIDNLREEMVDLEKMKADPDPDIAEAARMAATYESLLQDKNALDFSAIQIACYHLLKENPQVLQEVQEQIRYIMVDEYQDTNYIQEQLVFLLGAKHQNICVVGDDDQGLYRFRGATIRNILEFPKKFAEGTCRQITLVENYRSNPEIVDFYSNWMQKPDREDLGFTWGSDDCRYRYEKNLVSNKKTQLQGPAVAKLSEVSAWVGSRQEGWRINPDLGVRTLEFLKRAKSSGKVSNYNQIAFLQHSVKSKKCVALASYLEAHGVPVYSPRARQFFDREEVRLALGAFMCCFPDLWESVTAKDRKNLREPYKYMTEVDRTYYRDCLRLIKPLLKENPELYGYLKAQREELGKLRRGEIASADVGFSAIFYQILAFEPFKSMLAVDLADGVMQQRAARNLASITTYLVQFEEQHNISVLSAQYVDRNSSELFCKYLRYLREDGIDEYEDETEYAPSGCVSFLTNHQAKGMEFPIVIVDVFNEEPDQKGGAEAMAQFREKLEKKYYARKAFEPAEDKVYFDFWREYYTAFSRAQDLLILSGSEEFYTPKWPMEEEYGALSGVEKINFEDEALVIESVKDNTLKDVFSFTSHIAVYDACPRQYKFFKELGFAPVRNGNVLFGTLVHETIEDIHKAVLRGEPEKVTMTNIQGWLDSNYNSLVLAHKGYLDWRRRKAAFGQVLDYVRRQRGNWTMVQQAEYEVSMVRPNYIMLGQIDLIRGKDGQVDIVDFKSEKKPTDEVLRSRMEHYRHQLQLYAYLVEQRTGQSVHQMQLYYTAEESDDKVVAFPYIKEEVSGTVKAFDATVEKILAKDFSGCARDRKTCQNCDFRHYCKG